MSLKTFSTPFTENLLGMLLISANSGTGFTLSDPGTYTLSSIVDWYHETTDGLAIGDMTAVVAGVDVTITITDTPVTWYCKIEHVGDQAPLVFKYDQPSPSTAAAEITSDAGGNTKGGDLALNTLGGGVTNTAFGKRAGDEIVDGNNNIMLGNRAGQGLGDVSNTLAIGSGISPINTVKIRSESAAKGPTWAFPLTFGDRVYGRAVGSAPTDANIGAEGFNFYLDEASDKLMVRVCYADGTTYKTGEIDLV